MNPISPPPSLAAPPAPTLRPFDDDNAIRTSIYDGVLKAASSLPPVTNGRHLLRLSNVAYADPETWTKKQQKEALLTGETLARRMKGTWELVDDATGDVIDKRDQVVARVPYFSPRGTFLHRGVEYSINHQQRLRSGIFARQKENGELESHANILPGKGLSHRYGLDPASRVFTMQFGTSAVPLMPVLQALGTSGQELQDAWGKEVYAANYAKNDPSVLKKLQARLLKKQDLQGDDATQRQRLVEAIQNMELDPQTTQRTLGKPFDRLSKEAILATTKKLLAVSRGETKPDDRDALPYQHIVGPEDLFVERLQRDHSGVRRGLLRKLSMAGDLAKMPSGALTSQLDQAILGSGLAQCYDDKTSVLTSRGWLLWKDVRDDDEFACLVEGCLQFRRATRIYRVPYGGKLLTCRTKVFSYAVTANHRCWSRRPDGDDYEIRTAEEIRDKTRMFRTTLGPLAGAVSRTTYTLSPVRERRHNNWMPSVTLDMNDWLSFLGWWLAEGWAGLDGSSYRVTIAQSWRENPAHVAEICELLSRLPFRWRYSKKGNEFVIRDKRLYAELISYGVRENKRIPRYVFCLPENQLELLFASYLKGDGNVHNGYRKSETVAAGLALDLIEISGRLNLTGRFSRRPLSSKNPNWKDSFVVSYSRRTETYVAGAADAARRGRSSPYGEKDYVGVVYCASVPGGLLYVLRDGKPHWSGNSLEEINPLEILDKQSRITRMGEGGLPSIDAIPDECYSADTEVFTAAGWLPWTQTTAETKFACLLDGRMAFCPAERLIAKPYVGPMYGIRTRTLDLLVTPNHRHWIRKYRCTSSVERCGLAAWEYELAAETHRRPRQFLITSDPYVGETSDFSLPRVPGSRKDYAGDAEDWAELLGWYASEGSVDSWALRETAKYRVQISQNREVNPENCDAIAALLTKLKISFSYHGHNFAFVSKQLGVWLTSAAGLGCQDKRLPEECFTWPQAWRKRLLTSLVAGDGHARENGHTVFTSTSQRLCQDVGRLATTLGLATREYEGRDRSHDGWSEAFACGILVSTTQGVTSERMYDDSYYVEQYSGMVYCAEVPGGLLLVRRNKSVPCWSGNSRGVHPSHLGFLDPTRTVESLRIGVDLNIASGALKGSDGLLYRPVVDAKSGKTETKSMHELADATIGFAGGRKNPWGRVQAIRGGEHVWAAPGEVDYYLPDHESTFSSLANMVPFKSAIKAQRTSMGSRMLTQAVNLQKGEAPLVRNAAPGDGVPYVSKLGKFAGAVRAEKPGTVMAVGPDGVTIRGDDGKEDTIELYDHFPFNRKSFLHQTPVVKPGDRISKDQLLARSNYTDDKGDVALGLNLRAAYMPYLGYNHEDAVAVSESAARKYTSEHAYQHDLELDDRTHVDRKKYLGLYGQKFGRDVLAKLDDKGVVKVGQTVRYGDPLILAVREKEESQNRIHKRKQPGFADASTLWDHHDDGVVTDVVWSKKGPTVVVKAASPLRVGDKLSGLYGDKGVVAEIIPDAQMPHDGEGNPFEILLNEAGIITRSNPGQEIEAMLGKLAKKRGKPIDVKDFDEIEDLTEWARRELAREGIPERESVAVPRLGKTAPNVATGVRWIMKLHHSSESKLQGRSSGAYTAEGTPAKGGYGGAKRVALLDTNALLAHGAFHTLDDVRNIRGQKREDWWLQFMQGHSPRDTHVPDNWKKFAHQLQAAGINVQEKGDRLNVLALTGKDVDELAGDRSIQSGETVNLDDKLSPINGGLFDPKLTGGHHGKRWSAIDLHEPMPNPVMEEPIRRLLGLTQKEFEGVLSGDHEIKGFGSGPKALHEALQSIDVDRELAKVKAQYHAGSKTAKSDAAKKWGYLKMCKDKDLHPGDWVLKRAPVLPPVFRPISVMGSSGIPLVSDPNYLYKSLIEANDVLADAKKELGDKNAGQERLGVYQAFKAVTGLAEPTHPKLQEKGVTGILKSIFGNSPKHSTLQRKLLSTPVDNVGRAVIVPDPEFDMDSLGVPENAAYDIYKRFVVRRLRRRGLPVIEALRHLADKTSLARSALEEEMAERPVYMNRAPVLHKFGIMAFRPKIVKGDAMHVPPLVMKGYNMDADGDAVQFHVATTEKSIREALERMLPSRNLIAPSDMRSVMHAPQQEYAGGLYKATAERDDRAAPHYFKTTAEAVKAYKDGRIRHDTPIVIMES